VGEGDTLGLLVEGEVVAVGSGVAVGVTPGVVVGVAFGVAVGLMVAEADAVGEVAAAGVDEPIADGVALAIGFAFLASLSRTPARRSKLCFAVKKVSNKVMPKKIAPR
jgi:hypothetical protein